MRKVLSLVLLVPIIFWHESIYDLEIKLVSRGQKVSMSTFEGKTLLVATVDALNPDISKLQAFDSLVRADKGLAVIIVPVTIGDELVSDKTIKEVEQSHPMHILITVPARVRKSSGQSQHALFKWFTNASKNGHFDIDVKSVGQMFAISPSGTLYSVMDHNVPMNVLVRILHQEQIK